VTRTPSPRGGRASAAAGVLAVVMAAVPAGCGTSRMSGELRAQSLGDEPVFLQGEYATAYYGAFDATETSIFITDLPLDQLLSGEFTHGLVVHLDLLWMPRSGKTPMDRSATNLSIRYVVFADGEVGVYGGAGFAMPSERSSRMSLIIEDASLTLLEATEGFVDLLSPAKLTGSLTAALDEPRTRQMQRVTSQLVTNALGKSMIVEAGRPEAESTSTRPPTPSSSAPDGPAPRSRRS